MQSNDKGFDKKFRVKGKQEEALHLLFDDPNIQRNLLSLYKFLPCLKVRPSHSFL